MGASTKKSGFQGPALFAAQQQQEAYSKEQEQKAAAQRQYEVDQRSQYEKLVPQDLKDKISFEDAYADRGPEAAYKKAQEQYAIDQRSQYEKLVPQNLRDKISFKDAYADRGPEAAYKKAQEQYAIDQRSQYEKLVPQNLKDKISFEDAYADRGPARQGIGRDSRSEYFDLDQFNRLKAEVDQQGLRNNTGIAFGPGRSNRGNISLARQLQNRRQIR